MKRTLIGAVVMLLVGAIVNWWTFSIHSSGDWDPDWLPWVAAIPGLLFGGTVLEATGAKEALILPVLYSSVALQWLLPGAAIGYVLHRYHRRKLSIHSVPSRENSE